MRKEGLAALVALLAVASFGVGYLTGNDARTTETTTSISSSTVTFTVTSTSTETSVLTSGILAPVSSASTPNPITGLSLNLNLSTNTNGQVAVTTYEFNTLNRINNVSYGSNWPKAPLWQWTTYDCNEGSMMGFEVLHGNYGLNNYSIGMALWPHSATIAQGGCMLTPDNGSYSFNPLSIRSLVSGTYAGYWIGGQTYTPFAPGMYTVVAGDEWGQVAILHFVVAG